MKSTHLGGHFTMAVLLATLFIWMRPDNAEGGTNVVTTTSDTGAGSLRQAITAANLITSGANVINFNISGPGPFTITPATALPTVTNRVIIDGYTQPGASPNTLTNGDNAVLKINVLGVLIIDATNSVVRGLAIQGIDLGAAPGPKGSNIVEGCFVGLDASGTNSLADNNRGVFVQTPRNRIGGTAPASRNVISGNGATGIEVFDVFATNTVIQGNYIGTDLTGTKGIGNTDRALVINGMASAATIGGTAPGAGNLISGNLDRGITLDGSNNIVQGNFIGTDVTGLLPLGNARTGVEIGGTGNTVGGTNSGAGNIIAFNGVDGSAAFTTNGVDLKVGSTGSVVLGNSIFNNLGLGIDVGANGVVTPGFPVLNVVSNTGAATFIKGTNAPIGTFRLELFVNVTPDPSGFGEGKLFLGGTNVTTDGTGNFSLTWPAAIAPGLFITATGNGTTEFSSNRVAIVASGTNSWTNSLGGKWEGNPNWSLNVAPYLSQNLILITNAATKTVTSDAATATGFPGTLTISNLVVSAPTGATNTLLVAHGSTNNPLRILKSLTVNKGGAIVISNAALSLEAASGTGLSVDGTATLAGGQLTTPSASQIVVGNNGAGTLTVSNGNLQAYAAIVGANAGADGTWRIAGGTNFINTTFDIADSLTATGTVSLTGGQLSVPNAYIGLFGNGRLVVSNGFFQCFSQGTVASQDGAQGSFTAAGGTSSFGSMIIGENPLATGSVLVAGSAVVQINGALDNRGSVTVAGGSLNVLGQLDSVATNNAILVTGGQFAATNGNSFLTRVTVSNGTFLARDVFLGNSKFGTFTMAGGVVGTPGSFNGFSVGVNGGTGIVSQVGGLINLTNTDLNVGGLFGPAVGVMTISNGTTQARQVFVGGQGGGNGTFTLAGGTLVAWNLFVNPTSRLLLNKGLVQTFSTSASSTPNFAVGDSTNSAEFNLLGGTNVFTTGLRIASNSLVTGAGTIAANVTNAGVIAPGPLAARLNVKGNLVLSNSSELRLEIGGYNPATQFDFIGVTSNTSLAGKLSVSITNNFQTTMTNGASFTVLTNGTALTGAFANAASGGLLTTTEGYARFTVLYAGANTLRLTGLAVVDTDNDGLPDWWEDLYGLNKNNANDAALDLDGDGQSNLDEFRAGTLPNDANSLFHIVAFQTETNNVRVSWSTVGGKNYRVQTNAPSANGGLTTNFNDLSPVIPVGGSGESTTNYLHLGGATNAAARYYRVRVVP